MIIIPNTVRHVKNLIKVVKDNNLDEIEGQEKENYEQQFSYIEITSKNEAQLLKLKELLHIGHLV